MSAEIETMISARHETHGDFRDVSATSQNLKAVIMTSHNFKNGKLTSLHLEALDMILHKVARICSGDPNFTDHWDDIAGYAKRTSGML